MVNNIAEFSKLGYNLPDATRLAEVASVYSNVGDLDLSNATDNIVANLKAFIEPIMITSLAVVVGAIILAVIIPMFDLYGSISM